MSELAIHFTGDPVTNPAPVTLSLAPAVGGDRPPAVETPVAAPTSAGLPTFEKAEVARTEIKVGGTVTVDTGDIAMISLDDRLRCCGDFKVVKVLHYIDKDGAVVRQQIIAPIDTLDLVPWDATNPNDDGIVRAR